MANRLTDSEKWKKTWFRKLKPEHKLMWFYILDNCDHAGIWESDFELASFMIGWTYDQTEIEEAFEKQFLKIDENRWYLTDYIEWQYKCTISELNPNNKAHLGVIRTLEKHKIYDLLSIPYEAPSKPLQRGTGVGVGKGVGIGIGKGVGKKNSDNGKFDEEFEEVWKRYPRKDGKKKASEHFRASVKCAEDVKNINIALDKYLEYVRANDIEPKYTKNGSTWFNNWGDWVKYKPPIEEKSMFSEDD